MCVSLVRVGEFSRVLYLSSVLHKLYFYVVTSFRRPITREWYPALCASPCYHRVQLKRKRRISTPKWIKSHFSVVRPSDQHWSEPFFIFHQFNEIRILELFIFSVALKWRACGEWKIVKELRGRRWTDEGHTHTKCSKFRMISMKRHAKENWNGWCESGPWSH